MLHLHALLDAEGVDAAEPVLHAGVEHDIAALFHQTLPGQGDAPLVGLGDHGVHIGEDAVHPVGAAEPVGHRPELCRRHAQRGDEGVVLHVGGAEGFIKVIEKGHNGQMLFHKLKSFQKKSGSCEPLFMSVISAVVAAEF